MGEARRRREAGEGPRTGVAPTTCVRCGYGMECASDVGGGDIVPKPGDFSICARCGLPMRFEEGCRLRPLEVGEIEELDPVARARLFIACAALGSQNNPIRQTERTEPGRTVARVFWGEVDGVGRGLMVRAEGPSDVGLAIIVLCQGIANLDGFSPAQKNAAQALVTSLTDGRVDLPPVDVIRRGSESA